MIGSNFILVQWAGQSIELSHCIDPWTLGGLMNKVSSTARIVNQMMATECEYKSNWWKTKEQKNEWKETQRDESGSTIAIRQSPDGFKLNPAKGNAE